MKRRAFTGYYDDDSGDLISIDISPALDRECELMQADVLKDALGTIQELYMAAVKAVPYFK